MTVSNFLYPPPPRPPPLSSFVKRFVHFCLRNFQVEISLSEALQEIPDNLRLGHRDSSVIAGIEA